MTRYSYDRLAIAAEALLKYARGSSIADPMVQTALVSVAIALVEYAGDVKREMQAVAWEPGPETCASSK